MGRAGSKKTETQIRNTQNRAAGKFFEEILNKTFEYCKKNGIAAIEKTPEPRTVVGRTGDRNSMMICVNAAKSQPDYKGTLLGGKSVVIEAKHTDKDRITQSRVGEAQTDFLDTHESMGAKCFVVVSFSCERYFVVKWSDWKNMKEKYGRKYIMASDKPGKEIFFSNGVLDIAKAIK